jgi:hypothetical protein
MSQAAQAQYLSRFYLMAAKAGIAGVFWFQSQAHSSSATSVNDNYAVVTADGTTRHQHIAPALHPAPFGQSSVPCRHAPRCRC